MATIPLDVAGSTYNYPANNNNAPWGEDASAWAVAVTGVLSNVQGPGDILQTTATIANNVTSPTNIIGLAFSPAIVRGATVDYCVYRVSTGSGAMEAVELGTMYASYKTAAASWDLAIVGSQGASIVFSINGSGQVQYTSSNFTGSNYSGVISFRARALIQT